MPLQRILMFYLQLEIKFQAAKHLQNSDAAFMLDKEADCQIST